jgi:signal peptidase I
MSACVHEDAAGLKRELAEEVLRAFGRLRFAATGWSMLPTLLPGDTLVVERANPNAFRVGDIVLVGRDGKLCAHRVVSLPEVTNPFWITQGDAMLRPDRPVPGDEMLGQVTGFVRAGKNFTVSKKLNRIELAIARVLKRSEFAARIFVYLSTRVKVRQESSFVCQG